MDAKTKFNQQIGVEVVRASPLVSQDGYLQRSVKCVFCGNRRKWLVRCEYCGNSKQTISPKDIENGQESR